MGFIPFYPRNSSDLLALANIHIFRLLIMESDAHGSIGFRDWFGPNKFLSYYLPYPHRIAHLVSFSIFDKDEESHRDSKSYTIREWT